jgi:hypothetical protein
VVIKGEATPEEVAALVAVVSSLAAAQQAAAASDRPAASEWGAPHRKVRQSFPHGPGGWRASGLPR